ncbi:MAG: geranylgeranylglycerol-phosphate geranylgeranyltransferase [Flavihumibacter sp.]|nr:geranylgeranylglycerol-phosphate geranylgeranyltransferase [Flavihumibacter sp.]
MKLFAAFLRLVRWPNLVFIVLTQLLFYYCIVTPALQPGASNTLTPFLLGLLIASSVLIAAAGYIINDYFDLNIDQVNKPEAIVINKIIRRRWAIIWHLSLSAIGVVLAFYVGYKISNLLLGVLNLICVLLLWVYSTSLKKRLLMGNIVISLLTAWVVLVIYFCEFNAVKWLDAASAGYQHYLQRLFRLAVIYSGFAFIISLIREVVKDIEDMQGDAKYGCRTMPIVWGVPASKMFVAVWLVVLILAIIIIHVYGLMQFWWVAPVYGLVAIVGPLVYMLLQFYKASTPAHYHRISQLIKLVMFTGILSMIFFKWHI